MTPRRNLIFCAFGPPPGTVPFAPEAPTSGLLTFLPHDPRNWDLAIVLWHPGMIAAHKKAHEGGIINVVTGMAERVLYETDRAKRKFACFAEAWTNGSISRDYDAVAILDDDLTPADCTWSDVFRLFHESKLSVAQPALTRDSTRVWSWPVTHQEASSRYGREPSGKATYGTSIYRTTDFVEVMTPFFTHAAVEKALPFFRDEPYGLGLETWWHAEYAHRGELGVLDATPVQHTRPLGSAHSMTGLGEGDGSHPFEIARAFRKRHGLPEAFDTEHAWTLARWGRGPSGGLVQLPALPTPSPSFQPPRQGKPVRLEDSPE